MRDMASFLRHASSRSAIVTTRSPTRPTTLLADWANVSHVVEITTAPHATLIRKVVSLKHWNTLSGDGGLAERRLRNCTY